MSRSPRCVFVGTDLRGSLRVARDAAGDALCWFGDDVFGASIDSRTGGDRALADRLTRRYAGHAFEARSGLYDYGARLYDPALARFPTPDPAHETADPYAYCGNDPVNHIDLDGRGRQLVVLYASVAHSYVIVAFDKRGAYVAHTFDELSFGQRGLRWLIALCERSKLKRTGTALRARLFRAPDPRIPDSYVPFRPIVPRTWDRRTTFRFTQRHQPLLGTGERLVVIMPGDNNAILQRYVLSVGAMRGQWSALLLTQKLIDGAMDIDEHFDELLDFDKPRIVRMWNAMQRLRPYVEDYYSKSKLLEPRYYAAIGKRKQDPGRLAVLQEAQRDLAALRREMGVESESGDESGRGSAPTPHDDHGQYHHGELSKRDEDDEPPPRGGAKTQWDNVSMTWKGEKPSYYGADD